METIKYHLEKNGILKTGAERAECGQKDMGCGTWCAMFELRHNEQGDRWQAILHCCKRVIKLESEPGRQV